jgi:hypothetical protein
MDPSQLGCPTCIFPWNPITGPTWEDFPLESNYLPIEFEKVWDVALTFSFVSRQFDFTIRQWIPPNLDVPTIWMPLNTLKFGIQGHGHEHLWIINPLVDSHNWNAVDGHNWNAMQ